MQAQRDEQELVKQAEAPNPPTSQSGPVNQRGRENNKEGYEDEINNNEI